MGPAERRHRSPPPKTATRRNSTQVTHSVSFMRRRMIWGRVFTVDHFFQPARLLLDFISTPSLIPHDHFCRAYTAGNAFRVKSLDLAAVDFHLHEGAWQWRFDDNPPRPPRKIPSDYQAQGVGPIHPQGVTKLAVVGRQLLDNDFAAISHPVFMNTRSNHEGLVLLALVGKQTTNREDVFRADPAVWHVANETRTLGIV